MNYVAYYRVSTAQQGRSGLGLEAQQHMVTTFLRGEAAIASFTDIESGKRSENRPNLLAALALAKTTGATLLIAKLDRLSRSMSFISMLMDSKVKFICCDMPTATDLTMHVVAAVAQNEREMISSRTKGSLAAKVARGEALGYNAITSPENRQKVLDALAKGRTNAYKTFTEKADNNENNKRAKAVITLLRDKGETFQTIANKLNQAGFKTATGKEFAAMQVQRLSNKAA
jgi:DNA invertase Pin-like site-specific DNA recombinase